jgi:hypothetical protein
MTAMRRIHSELAKKFLFCTFFIIIFCKIFFFSWDVDWYSKYRIFSVPALTYPGGDFRTIQVTAFCASQGFPYFGKNKCIKKAEIVKRIYPTANVPEFNYPSIWPRIYEIFSNYTEKFFIKFWELNATLLVTSTLLLSLKYNFYLLPLVLFNPVTLLAVERGNIDATAFFLTFTPLLLLNKNSEKLHGFFFGLATAAKVFPIFGYLALINPRKSLTRNKFLFGALLSAPISLYSSSEIIHMVDGASKGFSGAYGLTSINHAPYFRDHPMVSIVFIFAYLIISWIVIYKIQKIEKLTKNIDDQISSMTAKNLLVLKTSLLIFICTFITFDNWAYRTIFLMPSLLILSKQKSIIEKIMFWNIFLIFWLPIIRYGWILQNLACYTLAISSALLLIRIFKVENFLNKNTT